MNDANRLADWFVGRVRPGRVLSIGAARWADVDVDGLTLVELEQLATTLTHAAIFDHAWIDLTAARLDLLDLLPRVHRALKDDGLLLIALPYGAWPAPASGAVYLSSARRLLEPHFAVTDIAVIGPFVAAAGTRRAAPVVPAFPTLDVDEQAFNAHERRLVARIEELGRELKVSGARYRSLRERQDKVESELARATRDLADARRTLARLSSLGPLRWLPFPRGRASFRHEGAGEPAPAILSPETNDAPAGRFAAAGAPSAAAQPATTSTGTQPALATPAQAPLAQASPDWRAHLDARFADWLTMARSAPGDEIVVMFSGTTFVQEHRGNRPIRLTNVYLDRTCPVFFNYFRWRDTEPLPDHPDRNLFQSPIDATPGYLDRLLTADFGRKRKIFFASFPHEIMVRYLTLAAQHGWVTVYDARDDWEEFAKVGMAKWYHPGYERYVLTHADLVTAVSRPLARKLTALTGRTVVVNPNGLDARFPLPEGGRVVGASPVVGYFGHLTDKWFDWPLLIATAQRYPDYRFELAGHQAPTLKLPSNVELLGLLAHNEIAERSRRWLVAIIPFKNGPLTDAVDPIKIYEYLHLGLPVLTTYFPQCRDYPGTVITEGRDEFVDQLAQLVNAPPSRAGVSTWLEANTWERRVDAYRVLADEVRQHGRTGVMALLGEGR